MTIKGITTREDAPATPVACGLTPASLARQSDRWERLAARAMTGRAETADGLRISFRPGPRAEEELRTLAAVENECCPWADWSVSVSAGQLVLDIHAAGDGITALHGMFTNLRPARAARCG